MQLATDGSIRERELSVGAWSRKRRWLDAFERRSREPLCIVDVCPECSGPLLMSQSTELFVACTHCDQRQSWALGQHVVDALPVLRFDTQSWGGGMQLQWQPAPLWAEHGTPLSCPDCGAPVPPFVGKGACAHCAMPLYALHACGRRFFPGVYIRGDDEGVALDGWMALPDALDHYMTRFELLKKSGRSGCRRYMGYWGLGAALMVCLTSSAFAVFVVGSVTDAGQGATTVGFVLFGLGLVCPLLFVPLGILQNIRKHRMLREAIMARRRLARRRDA